MKTNTIDFSGNQLSVADIIKRLEDLEGCLTYSPAEQGINGVKGDDVPTLGDLTDMQLGAIIELGGDASEDADELRVLKEALEDLCGCGGDEQWRGDWYPQELIHENYFEEHARQLAEDLGLIPADAGWPAHCIDWEQAANELRSDYSSITIDENAFYYR